MKITKQPIECPGNCEYSLWEHDHTLIKTDTEVDNCYGCQALDLIHLKAHEFGNDKERDIYFTFCPDHHDQGRKFLGSGRIE